MRRSTFTGMRDIDIDILNKLDDKKLIEMCEMDQYLYSICNDQVFWQRRVISTYGKYLTLDEMKKGKGDRNWSDYYIEIYKLLKSKNPEYEAAKLLDDPAPDYAKREDLKARRHDLFTLLTQIKKVDVKRVIDEFPGLSRIYYVSVHNGDYIKQGPYIMEQPGEFVKGEYLNGKPIGRWVHDMPGSYSETTYYDNGVKKSYKHFEDGRGLIEREYYDKEGKPTKLHKWLKDYY